VTANRRTIGTGAAIWRDLQLITPAVGLVVYAMVWLIPALTLAWRIAGGTLGWDLFEHAAAVRELATHPFQPGNPILLVDLPHTLFSPYSLLAAAIVRLSGADPFDVLSIAGFVNAVILAAGFRAFVRIFTKSDLALILSAAFALFLWGSAPLHLGVDPWVWSGFLNLDSLSYGLPYPSAVAMGLAFFALSLLATFLQRGGRLRLAAAVVIQALVVVLHPYSALFIVIGLAALIVAYGSRLEVRRSVAAVAAIATGTVVCFAWPYFSIVQLLTGQVGAFDWEQRAMYSAVVLRIFPALVGLPFLALRFRADRRDPLAWLFGGLSAVYVVGVLTAHYTLGRELPYVMICLDIALAIGFAGILSRAPDPEPRQGRLASLPVRGIVAACLLPVVLLGSAAVVEVLTTGETHADVEGLARLTSQYDVVLADHASYPAVPTWGGKLVAWYGALGFIPDIVERRSQAAAFFDPSETLDERLALLRQYGVRWVLYGRNGPTFSAAFEASIPQWGKPYATSPDGAFVLVSVGP
jgi:hypothetical protein